MGLFTAFAIYFLIWWLVLFVTLPFGMRSQLEMNDVVAGTEPAAPANPQMGKRLLWNTIISLVVFAVYWFVIYYLGYGLDSLPDFMPQRSVT